MFTVRFTGNLGDFLGTKAEFNHDPACGIGPIARQFPITLGRPTAARTVGMSRHNDKIWHLGDNVRDDCQHFPAVIVQDRTACCEHWDVFVIEDLNA